MEETKTLCINDLKTTPVDAANTVTTVNTEGTILTPISGVTTNLESVDINVPVQNISAEEKSVVEMNIADLRPFTPEVDPVQENVNALFNKLDEAVEAKIERDEKFLGGKIAEYEEQALDKEIDGNTNSDDSDNALEIDDMEDKFDDLLEDTDPNKKDDEQMTELKNIIKERIKPVTAAIDLTSFTISKKHVSVTSTLRQATPADKHIADWALMATHKPISISELAGYEIEKLNPGNETRNRYNTYREIYQIIYDHIVDENKPAFDVWLKQINFFDNVHLYFAIYKACFEGVNDIPYVCPECQHAFIADTATIDTMVKYKTKEDKEKLDKILEGLTDTVTDEYEAELLQISDTYVVSLREPSIWNMIFEHAILNQEFTTKYSDFLGIMVYIDGIYSINRETHELDPIDVEEDPKNLLKLVKSRIVKYSAVFKTLSSDQLQLLQACIAKINIKHDGVTYVLPAATCPKCGKVIEEQTMEPDQLLFMRHQLAAIANI